MDTKRSPGEMIAGQSIKRRTVVKKCHVLVTMHSDSVKLLPLLDCTNSQTFNKVCYTQYLHAGGTWGLRQGLYLHLGKS